MRTLISACAMAADRNVVNALVVLIACAVFSTGPAFADQAQTDLAAALAYNQQMQQQQMMMQQQQLQQQTQMQNQQFALGTAGVQPYCNYYGTCPNPLAAQRAQQAGLAVLFGIGAQPAAAVEDQGATPMAPAHPRHRRHHRIHP